MLKLDENFKEITDKVMVYFGKFESKWNQIISERKKTKIPIENNDKIKRVLFWLNFLLDRSHLVNPFAT
jgi:hypothetical protein